VGGFVLDKRFGLDQGFDVYDSPFNLRRQAGKDPGDVKRPGEEVTRAAERWLEANSAAPFFVFVHLYDLHTPYELPPGWRARLQPHATRKLDYETELAYVDDVLGEFWDFLGRRGLLGRALIIFTSDHGESLGEHGEDTHGYFIYQSTLRVPLIIHWPERQPAAHSPLPTGSFAAKVSTPRSLLDLAPTILHFAGIALPAEFQGRSLLGLLASKADGVARVAGGVERESAAEEIYSESLYAHRHFGTSPLRSLRVGAYKYIEEPRPELYDLSQDPGEARNLYVTRRSLALSLRERMISLRSRFRSERVAVGSATPSPETLERLRSLGYASVSSPRAASSTSGPDPKDRIGDYGNYGRALALASAGHLEESNAMLGQLLERDPKLLDVRLSLGLNEQKLGRHPDAARNFEAVLKEDPLNSLAHFDLGVSEFELHQPDVAIKELEAALAIAPYSTRAEGLLATIWLQKQDYERARAHLEHILSVAPSDYLAHYNLGVLATIQGRWEQGEQQLRAAIEADPESAEAHNSLGSLYFKREDLKRAAEEFQLALHLDPKFAWAHYNLGMVLQRQQKNDEAAREFHKALEADPEFRAARQALDRLQSPWR
jgi:tetratricopeptide (TPR) repeat protein